jgi:hypothetical protein
MRFESVSQKGFITQVIFLLLLISSFSTVKSQEAEIAENRNSIGIGIGLIPSHHGEKFVPAIDLCYGYAIADRWCVGAGAGIHFTKSPFYILAAKADYDLFKGLALGAAAGMAFQDDEISSLVGMELCYEFDLKHISIGPKIEVSYHNRHEHFHVGIHVSRSFK